MPLSLLAYSSSWVTFGIEEGDWAKYPPIQGGWALALCDFDMRRLRRTLTYLLTCLGHILTTDMNDKTDIIHRKHSLCGQMNDVLCYFGKRQSITVYFRQITVD